MGELGSGARCETCLFGRWADPIIREHGYTIICQLDESEERRWACCDAYRVRLTTLPATTLSGRRFRRRRDVPDPPWESAHDLAVLLSLKARGVVQR